MHATQNVLSCNSRYIRSSSLVIALAVALAVLHTPPAHAHHATITDADYVWAPGPSEEAPTGYRVFLAAPRHSNSGSRGECLASPRKEENINGRYFNTQAGGGAYYVEQPSTSTGRNLVGRGYRSYIGRNSKDNGYRHNVTLSNNWGANIHLVTHTNAVNGCPESPQYFIAFYRASRSASVDMATKVRDVFSPSGITLSSVNLWDESRSGPGSLYELGAAAPSGTAYMEISFHSNQVANYWLSPSGEGKKRAWRYGLAVDRRLGYP